ncbi:hypothetical protein [Micromonospora sp. KC606]|uniref:hypothetical protein n=1 Tax=Micromonospora sp. KC606 TaxID=2530379 RepID=UPI001FB5A6B2|nr:hypothetical protein [Micromonospora sp. KC606]
MHQRGDQPVGEHELVFRPSANSTPTRPRGKPITVPGLPARRQLRNQALDHPLGQPRHDRSTNHASNNDHRCSKTRIHARGR